MRVKSTAAITIALNLLASIATGANYPEPVEGDFVLHEFHFDSGESMSSLRIHYRTIGTAVHGADGLIRNAVLVLHGTTANGGTPLRPEFAGELFGPGQLLDARRYFIVLPDGIGHGGSSKPSDGLRARFPHFGYRDMVEAQFRLLTQGLGVEHARLIIGASMGGMQTWLWGELHPDFMDALMPLASLPDQVSGRNRVWRRLIIDAIRHDPSWEHGDYRVQPASLRTAEEMLWLVSSTPVLRQHEAPTLQEADRAIDAYVQRALRTDDANDLVYQLEASRDYDPGPLLGSIKAPLFAVNSADDLINPPQLGILEREIKRLPRGRAVVLPASALTRGHGTDYIAAAWKEYLRDLLDASEPLRERTLR